VKGKRVTRGKGKNEEKGKKSPGERWEGRVRRWKVLKRGSSAEGEAGKGRKCTGGLRIRRCKEKGGWRESRKNLETRGREGVRM